MASINIFIIFYPDVKEIGSLIGLDGQTLENAFSVRTVEARQEKVVTTLNANQVWNLKNKKSQYTVHLLDYVTITYSLIGLPSTGQLGSVAAFDIFLQPVLNYDQCLAYFYDGTLDYPMAAITRNYIYLTIPLP